jgi:hypothetical protein
MFKALRSRITKRAAIIGGAGAIAVAGVAAAVVLTTASGTGSGIIVAGTVNGPTGGQNPSNGIVRLSVDPLTLSDPGFVPGGAPATINLDVTNPNDNAVLVTTVSFGGVSSTNGACQALISANPQFLQIPSTVTENATVPANTANFPLPNPTTLTWVKIPTLDQSPCSGQPLVLTENTP